MIQSQTKQNESITFPVTTKMTEQTNKVVIINKTPLRYRHVINTERINQMEQSTTTINTMCLHTQSVKIK